MSNKNDSRENILKAATKLFNLQGYHATGLNQILRESDAPKGSLYYHFPNGKEQLATEAVHMMSVVVMNEIKKSFTIDSDPVVCLQKHIERLADRFDTPTELEVIPIGLLAAETSLKSESLRLACLSAFKGWESIYIERLLEFGYEEEQAKKLSVILTGLVEGSITRSLTNRNGDPLRYAAEIIPTFFKK